MLSIAPVAILATGSISDPVHADDVTAAVAAAPTEPTTTAVPTTTAAPTPPLTSTTPTTTVTTPTTTATTPPSVTSGPGGRIEVVTLGAGATRAAVRLKHSGSIFFPLQVAKGCAVLNNYAEARSGGRAHEGQDIASPLGTPVYAVVDGTLNRQVVNGAASSSLSGNAWYLTDPMDKTYYFYAHLSGFKDGLAVGATVRQGDVIGYVGNTGNPGPGNYHLHFEVHPKGGSAVDPLPLLSVPFGCAVY